MRLVKIIISLFYVAILLVLGVATFLENNKGMDWTHSHIYGSWWFASLWGVLAVMGVIYFFKMHIRRLSVILLHASLVIILIGAFVSHVTGRSGTIQLRKSEAQDIVEIVHNGNRYLHRLPYFITLENFEVVTDDKDVIVDYRSDFKIDGTSGSVSMNKIFRYGNLRFYQMSYDNDMCGSTLAINRDPYGIPITYCGYLLLFASFISLSVKSGISSRGRLVAIAITLIWCLYYFVLDGSWTQIPVLRSPLLFAHVVTIILAYAMFLIQAMASAIWLLRYHKTSNDRVPVKSHAMLIISLCLLAIGIFLGAIWANISWGNYWSWDSKEVWALITFMLYAIPLHRRSFPAFNYPKSYHTFLVLAFLSILMTYFGVNYFLSGMHSYA